MSRSLIPAGLAVFTLAACSGSPKLASSDSAQVVDFGAAVPDVRVAGEDAPAADGGIPVDGADPCASDSGCSAASPTRRFAWAAGHELLANLGETGASSLTGAGVGATIAAGQVLMLRTPETGAEPHLLSASGAITLLKDIVPGLGGSEAHSSKGRKWLYFSSNVVSNGELAFFHAGDEEPQLWRTDGTPQGTVFVAQVSDDLLAVGDDGRAQFSGPYGQPWATDGTPQGTIGLSSDHEIDVPEFLQKPGHLWPSDVHRTSGGTYRRETDGVHWVAAEGGESRLMIAGNTTLIGLGPAAMIHGTLPGGTQYRWWWLQGSADPQEADHLSFVRYNSPAVAFRGGLFFGDNSIERGALWRSDGALAGPQLVTKLPGTVERLFVLSDMIVAHVSGSPEPNRSKPALWTSDGTEAGTRLLFRGPLGNVSQLGDRIFLARDDETHGFEPWVTDGTLAGTHALGDIAPGTTSSAPRDFFSLGDKVFFSAQNPALGRELWWTEGKPGDAQLVADHHPGTTDLQVEYFAPMPVRAEHGLVFFSGQRLWRTDGTAAGTAALANGPQGELLLHMDSDGHSVFLLTRKGEQYAQPHLWVSHGTEETTRLVGAFAFDGCERSEEWICAIQRADSFAVSAGFAYWVRPHNDEIVVSDGLASAPHSISLSGLKGAALIPAVGGGFFVLRRQGSAPDEYRFEYRLWRSDGTQESTRATDMAFSSRTSDEARGFMVGNRVLVMTGRQLRAIDPLRQTVHELQTGNDRRSSFFAGNPDFGLFLAGENAFVTDGTVDGTVRADSLSGWQRVGADTAAYYVLAAEDSKNRLWRVDAAGKAVALAAGPAVRNTWNADSEAARRSFRGIVFAGQDVYFSFAAAETGAELWVSDGTPGGTRLLADVLVGPDSSNARPLGVFGKRLVYVASHPLHGLELFGMALP